MYLTEAEITCGDGYEVTAGDEIRTCEVSGNGTAGEWSGEEPTCSGTVKISCCNIEIINNNI